MAFTPKFASAYEAEFLGLLHALTGGVDITEGSPDSMIAKVHAIMMQTMDARLRSLVAARGLQANGRDADEVVAQIMSGVPVRRRSSVSANGPIMVYNREDTVGVLTVPAGVVFRSSVDASLEYRSTEAVTFADGQASYPSPSQSPVAIIALQPGSKSNTPTGTLTVVVPGTGAPNQITSVTNSEALGNGEDEESTASMLQRAQLTIAAIAKAQPMALRALAQRFTGADTTTIRDAVVFSPPDIPGYSELVVSDGFGLQGYITDATWQTGTVGVSGLWTITFDGPAATEPLLVLNPDPLLPVGSGATPAGSRSGTVVLHEQGVVEFIGDPLLPGTKWAIGGHKVYTGVIAELQGLIEGDWSAGTSVEYGWKACGTRVRVRPPITNPTPFTVRAVFRSGADVDAARDSLAAIISGYLASVGIGGTLSLFRLIDVVGNYSDVVDFQILSPSQNIASLSRRHQFYTNRNLITFV